MAKKIGSRTVTIIRQAKVDRLDDAATGTPPEHDITGCVVLPRAASGAQNSAEDNKGWTIIEGRMVIAPFGADVLADDRARVDGQVWEVDGAPGDYENKRGVGKATMFYLKRLGT